MVFALRGNPCNGCLKLRNTSFVRSIIIIMLALLRRQSTNKRLKLYDDSNFISLAQGKNYQILLWREFSPVFAGWEKIETVWWLCPKKLFVWIVNLCFLRDYYDNNNLTARSVKDIIMLQWPGVTFPPGYHYFLVNSATMALVAQRAQISINVENSDMILYILWQITDCRNMMTDLNSIIITSYIPKCTPAVLSKRYGTVRSQKEHTSH